MQLERAKQTLFTQKHIGLDITDAAHSHDAVTKDPLKIRNVPRHDPQTVIITPQHMLNGLHLQDSSHGTFEIFKADLPAGGKLYA
jgi:hypothetical protein